MTRISSVFGKFTAAAALTVASLSASAITFEYSPDVAAELKSYTAAVTRLHNMEGLEKGEREAWIARGRMHKALQCYMSRVTYEAEERLGVGAPNLETQYSQVLRELQVKESSAIKLLYPQSLDAKKKKALQDLLIGPSKEDLLYRERVSAIFKGRELQECASPTLAVDLPAVLKTPVNSLSHPYDRMNGERLVRAVIDTVAVKKTYTAMSPHQRRVERVRGMTEWSAAAECLKARYYTPEEWDRGDELVNHLSRLTLNYLAHPQADTLPVKMSLNELYSKAEALKEELAKSPSSVQAVMTFRTKYPSCF